jgi:WD40 repeat protein
LTLAASLRKIREKGGTTTRKLIGHSGPVYSVDFDPVGGSAAPPRYLLSASADATTRLWSLDTMTNIVAYRGHQNPVWDVKWSPMGIYFATGSRDRTARLWSTDRTSCLRIFAGHLSDVDVSDFDFVPRADFDHTRACSACSFTLIHCTSPLGPVTGQLGCGTFNTAHVSEYLWDIRERSPPLPSALMVAIWPLRVCSLSWFHVVLN